MTAMMMVPLFAETIVEAGAQALYPKANVLKDNPAYEFRSASATTVTFDITLRGDSYDTIAIIGHNLRTQDTIRVQTFYGEFGGAVFDDSTVFALTASPAAEFRGKTIFALSSDRTARFLRVTFNLNGAHPDGFASCQRIAVGKRVETDGIDVDTEMSFFDNSQLYENPNWTSVDEYRVQPELKFKMSFITYDKWRTEISPMMLQAGTRRPIVFVPRLDERDYHSEETLFGRLIGKPYSGKMTAWDMMTVDGVIRSFSA